MQAASWCLQQPFGATERRQVLHAAGICWHSQLSHPLLIIHPDGGPMSKRPVDAYLQVQHRLVPQCQEQEARYLSRQWRALAEASLQAPARADPILPPLRATFEELLTTHFGLSPVSATGTGSLKCLLGHLVKCPPKAKNF